MNKRPRKATAAPFRSNNGIRRISLKEAASAPDQAVQYKRGAFKGRFLDARTVPAPSMTTTRIFVGPSVEGTDVEYIEVMSGKVSKRKPSFVR